MWKSKRIGRKGITMEKYTVEHAVQNCLDEITDAQVAHRILDYLVRYLNEKRAFDRSAFQSQECWDAINTIRSVLYKELSDAWSALTYFSTVDMRAKEAVHNRAKSWFERNDVEIMSFVGEGGSFYTVDEEKFRNSLKHAFGIED